MVRKLLQRVPRLLWVVLLLIVCAAGIYAAVVLVSRSGSNSSESIRRWFNDPASRAGLMTRMNGSACPDAPFILPSDGFIGLLWDDPDGPYSVFNTHSGIDIFGDGRPGEVPVYAAYDGYLTRLDEWLSTLIIRHDDPLQPGRTIWTYYTHMASRDGSRSFIVPDYPPGTAEQFVEQGTVLGYQGDYAGAGASPVGLHLHFSIVLSDAEGYFMNEAHTGNTLNPSPYLGMGVHIAGLPARPIQCDVAE